MSSHRLMNQVRKVYESLQTDNLTAATKKGALLLKENPNSDWAKVVWVDLLLHQNKVQEASAFVEKSFVGTVSDVQVLPKITRILKRLGKDEQLVTLCKQAWTAHQNTKNAIAFGEQLFAAYVRHGNLNLQKQFAAELGKKFKDDKFMVWNMALQENNPMFVQLATMMFKRHFQEKQTTEQELFFFCWFMKQAGKPAEALELLIGDLGKKVVKIEYQRLEKVAEMYLASNNWEQALAIFEDLIKNYMDDWKWYEGYLNAVYSIASTNPEKKAELLETYTKLVEEKKVGTDGKPKQRNPYLARLEVEKRALADDTSDLQKLSVEYFEIFGSKPCAYHDLLPYLPHLPKEKYEDFLALLQGIVAAHESNKKKLIEFQSSFYQIKRTLVKPTTVEEAKQAAAEVFKIHLDAETLPGEGKDRRPTERGIGDTFVVLAAHYLIDAWALTSEYSYLYDALVVLEYALKQTPTNFQVQILLMRLAGTLGSVQRIFEVWETMDIRNIMHDTLPHLVLPDVLRYLGYMEASKLCKGVEKVHLEHEMKMAGYIADCYFKGAYAQIDEFSSFKKRLERSSQLYIVHCESTHLQLLSKGVIKENTLKTLESSPLDVLRELLVKTSVIPGDAKVEENFLRDNQDWTVMDQWDLTPRKERKGWLWKGLMDEEATTSAHCQKSYVSASTANKPHLVLQLRSLQLLLLRDLVASDSVKKENIGGYEQLTEKLGYKLETTEFDAAAALAVLFGYKTTLELQEFTQLLKAEKTDLPAVLASGDALNKVISSFTTCINAVYAKAMEDAPVPKKIPRVLALAHTINQVSYLLLQQVALIPKQTRKTLANEAKDKHTEVKQSLKDILTRVKEILTAVSAHGDELAKASSASLASLSTEVLDLVPESAALREQVENTTKSASKLTLTRLLDIFKDRIKLLQPCKL